MQSILTMTESNDMVEEYVNGDKYKVIRDGSCDFGGHWHILDGGNKLIVTVPKVMEEDDISVMLKGYNDWQWGHYYMRHSKRWCITVSDLNVDKLESCLQKI